MFPEVGLRGAARLWYAKNLAGAGAIPYARDTPRASAGEGPADHVLLLGNGPAHGWGVSSHQLALCGQLARALFRATERAAEVEYVGAELMNAESALAWLGDHDLSGYDAVVVVMGMNDAVRLTSVKTWQLELSKLLEHLRGGLRNDAPIVVAGIQPVDSVPPYRGLVARMGQRQADVLNQATRRLIAATPGVAFAALDGPDLEPGRPYGSVTTYRGWADALTVVAAPLLDAHHARGSGRRRSRIEPRQWAWAGAPGLLDAAADRGTPELRRLVNAAKIEFGVTLAVVTLLEGDRMWFAAASADTPVTIPRALSYDEHVPTDGALVVPDAGADPRFRKNPFIQQSHLPFYAGYPVHDLHGDKIGSFCVLSAKPRAADFVRMEVLAKYAAQTEQEFHRLELAAVAG